MEKLKCIALTAALATAGAAMAADSSPLWLRNAAISPDGNTVAFTYKGDIFTVSANGGKARQLTTSPYYDSTPVWSPDGSRIVFTSNRRGSDDIYIIELSMSRVSGRDGDDFWVGEAEEARPLVAL